MAGIVANTTDSMSSEISLQLGSAIDLVNIANEVIPGGTGTVDFSVVSNGLGSARDFVTSLLGTISKTVSSFNLSQYADLSWLDSAVAFLPRLKLVRDLVTSVTSVSCQDVIAQLRMLADDLIKSANVGFTSLPQVISTISAGVNSVQTLISFVKNPGSISAAGITSESLESALTSLPSAITAAAIPLPISAEDIRILFRVAKMGVSMFKGAVETVKSVTAMVRAVAAQGAGAITGFVRLGQMMWDAAKQAYTAAQNAVSGFSINSGTIGAIRNVVTTVVQLISDGSGITTLVRNALTGGSTAAQLAPLRQSALSALRNVTSVVRTVQGNAETVLAVIESLGDEALDVIDSLTDVIKTLGGTISTGASGIKNVLVTAQTMWSDLSKANVIRQIVGMDTMSSITRALATVVNTVSPVLEAADITRSIDMAAIATHVGTLRRLLGVRSFIASLADSYDSVAVAIEDALMAEELPMEEVTALLSRLDGHQQKTMVCERIISTDVSSWCPSKPRVWT